MEEITLEDFKLSIWHCGKKLLIIAATISTTMLGLILTFDTQISGSSVRRWNFFKEGMYDISDKFMDMIDQMT